MRNQTFGEKLLNFLQIVAVSFDVTGFLQEQLMSTRQRRFQTLLRKRMRDARLEARRSRLEEHNRYELMVAESEARRRAAQNLKSYRERVVGHRQHQDGFARDAEALSSDWQRISVDIQVVFDDFESRYPDAPTQPSLTHAAR